MCLDSEKLRESQVYLITSLKLVFLKFGTPEYIFDNESFFLTSLQFPVGTSFYQTG